MSNDEWCTPQWLFDRVWLNAPYSRRDTARMTAVVH